MMGYGQNGGFGEDGEVDDIDVVAAQALLAANGAQPSPQQLLMMQEQ